MSFLTPRQPNPSAGEPSAPKKNQNGLMRSVFKLARNKLISRKLEGSVEVSLSLGPLGSGLSCAVTESSVMEEETVDPILRTLLVNIDTILDDLEGKAQEFKGATYAAEMTLSGSCSVTLVEVSITVNISATVPALLARKVIVCSNVSRHDS